MTGMGLPVRVKYRNGRCVAMVPLRLTNGRTIVITRACSLAQVRRALRRRYDAPQVSGFFGGIGKAIKSVARSSAIRSAVSAASKAAQNPIVQSVLPPQVTMGLRAASAASKLVNIAKSGSPEAPRAQAVIRAASIAAQKEATMPPAARQSLAVTQMQTPSGRAFRYLVTINRAA